MKWGMLLSCAAVFVAGAQIFGQEATEWKQTRFQPPIVIHENGVPGAVVPEHGFQGPAGFSAPFEETGTVPTLDQPPVHGGARTVYPVHVGMPPMVGGPGGPAPPAAPGVGGPAVGPPINCGPMNGMPVPGCCDGPFDGCVPLASDPGCVCCESRCPLVRLISRCCGGCCDDCECPRQWYEKWCILHWCRSTGDMPLRYPYPPENHGYYYFRPYNYSHIQIARDLVPVHQADPVAPYETSFLFQKIYEDLIPPDARKPSDFDRPPDVPKEEPLPLLEDLLDPEAARKKAEAEAKKKDEGAKKKKKPPVKKPESKQKMPPIPPPPKKEEPGKKEPSKKESEKNEPSKEEPPKEGASRKPAGKTNGDFDEDPFALPKNPE